ncbi:MAG: signal peptide peptidase SppA [Muribaculaceae bacterium]|nr:signal peptide peptidase SppA [Muribaculaceae bacterium]
MKNFFISFFATIAGIWASALLGFIVLLLVIGFSIANMSISNAVPVKVEKNSVLYMDLGCSVTERKSAPDLMSQFSGDVEMSEGLNDIVKSIRHAANDRNIVGIYLDCKGINAGAATLKSIHDELKEFKKSDKWIIAYGDSYTQGDYYLSSLADSIYLNPVGSVDIHGMSASIMFYKELLDNLGVDMEVYKVGTYKSAVEPFILNDISEANKEQVTACISALWHEIAADMAVDRSLTEERINQFADSVVFTFDPERLVSEKLVDGLLYRHMVEDILAERCDKESADDLNLVPISDYASTVVDKSSSKNPTIAVVYAEGDIVDSGDGGIVGEDMAPLILSLADDEKINGLVLRVNSGGGSAFASEQIWEAIEVFKSKDKPVFVSMGDYAASGGYYISAGADEIYAEPTTITGSIGIFGLKPTVNKALKKIGINVASVGTNPNGIFMSILDPSTPYQQQAMQEAINRGYETFVGRCATGRKMSVEQIKQIAEGRVWDAVTAKKIGLVDKLGSLNDAISAMAKKLDAENYNVAEYPEIKFEWWEELLDMSSQYKQSVLSKELGESYKYYQAINKFQNLEPLQCRMLPIEIK